MPDYRIKLHNRDFLNNFKESIARNDYICENCHVNISKGTKNYVISLHPGSGHVHISCATKYQYRQRNIAHEYSAFPKVIGEWILAEEL